MTINQTNPTDIICIDFAKAFHDKVPNDILIIKLETFNTCIHGLYYT